jgi:hypothetical protein
MDLQIVVVENHGDQTKERVWLKADKACDIGKYVISDTSFLPNGNVSNKLRHVFWFPDQSVKAGDFILLHTGSGKATAPAKNDQNTMTYTYFWNLKEPVWNDDGDCAVLLYVSEWAKKRARDK